MYNVYGFNYQGDFMYLLPTARISLLGMVLLLTVPSPKPAIITSMSDGAFSTTNWTFATYTVGPNVTANQATMTSGGNPGAYHFDSVTFAHPPKSYMATGVTIGLYTASTWDPSAGTLTFSSITYDADVEATGAPYPTNSAYSCLCYQGGNYYVGPGLGVGPTPQNTWESGPAITGIVASNFSLLDMTNLTLDSTHHPDFSSSGGVVTFGFYTYGNQAAAIYTQTQWGGIDNWSITVYGT
jgi:hypothetical protein